MSETNTSVTTKRLRQILVICVTTAIVGCIVHVLPLPVALRTSVGAVATVVVGGLGVVAWLPPLRWDLLVSSVLAIGLSLAIVVTTVLLIARLYTPVAAAGLSVVIGLVLAGLRDAREQRS